MSGRFFGLGFGAIQAGLFAYEAERSGCFEQVTIAARRTNLVRSINQSGCYSINVATVNGVRVDRVENIKGICLDVDHLDELVEALVDASEIGVALSSVDDYVSHGSTSIHRLLAKAVQRKSRGDGPKAIIYCAENHHKAAQILETAIISEFADNEREIAQNHFQCVDTVIGKMSRQVDDRQEIKEAQLAVVADGVEKAILVEAFNKIQISQVDSDRTAGRGISIFEEQKDLRPFEHAKLHGHNATHAMLAYFGRNLGLTWISDVCARSDIHNYARSAFLQESGAALIKLHGGDDPLFTKTGYSAYADDLLVRMANPYLRDTCERIGRDIRRKLGWNDRLIGTIRLALEQDIQPDRYGHAALAALRLWQGHTMDLSPLLTLWQQQGADAIEMERIFGFLTIKRTPFRQFMDELVGIGAQKYTTTGKKTS